MSFVGFLDWVDHFLYYLLQIVGLPTEISKIHLICKINIQLYIHVQYMFSYCECLLSPSMVYH